MFACGILLIENLASFSHRACLSSDCLVSLLHFIEEVHDVVIGVQFLSRSVIVEVRRRFKAGVYDSKTFSDCLEKIREATVYFKFFESALELFFACLLLDPLIVDFVKIELGFAITGVASEARLRSVE